MARRRSSDHEGDHFVVRKAHLLSTLRNVFNHEQFRSDLQRKAIEAICKGNQDAFISMPTGAGKSLCFQLPAVYMGGVSIVISPLIALMHDQLHHLQKLKIPAETINSKQSQPERKRIIDDLMSKQPRTCLLYITPEQAFTATFQNIIKKLTTKKELMLFVIDEAHCVSQWGHDFRADYMKIGSLRKTLGNVPFIALTATAAPKVEKDIINSLQLRMPLAAFRSGVFRPNLFYSVKYKDILKDRYLDLKNFALKALGKKSLDGKYDGCGIVYCHKRDDCTLVAGQLLRRGLMAKPYHAGLKDKERTQVQEEWMAGQVTIIVATISFGMGVDKANVRFVAHWTIPKSMANYYQESGRAGRDGKTAYCCMYYSRQDRDKLTYLLRNTIQQKKKKMSDVAFKQYSSNTMGNFTSIVKYCENINCRHESISVYFGHKAPDCKSMCDHCHDLKALRKHNDDFLKTQLANAGVTRIREKVEKHACPTGNFDPDLYLGGRKGFGFDRTVEDDWSGEGTSGGGSNEISTKEWSNFFKEQFKMRKGGKPTYKKQRSKSRESNDDYPDDCPLLQPGSSHLPNCNWTIRKGCFDRLHIALANNHEAVHGKNAASDWEAYDAAANAEYEVFSAAKNLMIYRAKIVKRIGEIRKLTAEKKLDTHFENAGSSSKPEVEKQDSDSEEFIPSASLKRKRASHIFALSGVSNPSGDAFQTAASLLKEAESEVKHPRIESAGTSHVSDSPTTKARKQSIRFNDKVDVKSVEKYLKRRTPRKKKQKAKTKEKEIKKTKKKKTQKSPPKPKNITTPVPDQEPPSAPPEPIVRETKPRLSIKDWFAKPPPPKKIKPESDRPREDPFIVDLTLFDSDSDDDDMWSIDALKSNRETLALKLEKDDSSDSSDSDGLVVLSEYNRYKTGPTIYLCDDESNGSDHAMDSAVTFGAVKPDPSPTDCGVTQQQTSAEDNIDDAVIAANEEKNAPNVKSTANTNESMTDLASDPMPDTRELASTSTTNSGGQCKSESALPERRNSPSEKSSPEQHSTIEVEYPDSNRIFSATETGPGEESSSEQHCTGEHPNSNKVSPTTEMSRGGKLSSERHSNSEHLEANRNSPGVETSRGEKSSSEQHPSSEHPDTNKTFPTIEKKPGDIPEQRMVMKSSTSSSTDSKEFIEKQTSSSDDRVERKSSTGSEKNTKTFFSDHELESHDNPSCSSRTMTFSSPENFKSPLSDGATRINLTVSFEYGNNAEITCASFHKASKEILQGIVGSLPAGVHVESKDSETLENNNNFIAKGKSQDSSAPKTSPAFVMPSHDTDMRKSVPPLLPKQQQRPSKEAKLGLKETSDAVVRQLSPFHKEGRIEDVALFKIFAKKLTSLVMEEKMTEIGKVKQLVRDTVNAFFKKYSKLRRPNEIEDVAEIVQNCVQAYNAYSH